jgi:CoA:oxalate CoA-transferase
VLTRPDIATDPRFADPDTRIDNEPALLAALRPLFADRNAADWEAALNAASVPAGAVRTVPQIADHPHTIGRDIASRFPIPGTDRLGATINLGFEGGRPADGKLEPPPRLGEHTDEILAGLDYDAAKIASLKASGSV